MTTAEIEQKLNAATIEIQKLFENIEIRRENLAKGFEKLAKKGMESEKC